MSDMFTALNDSLLYLLLNVCGLALVFGVSAIYLRRQKPEAEEKAKEEARKLANEVSELSERYLAEKAELEAHLARELENAQLSASEMKLDLTRQLECCKESVVSQQELVKRMEADEKIKDFEAQQLRETIARLEEELAQKDVCKKQQDPRDDSEIVKRDLTIERLQSELDVYRTLNYPKNLPVAAAARNEPEYDAIIEGLQEELRTSAATIANLEQKVQLLDAELNATSEADSVVQRAMANAARQELDEEKNALLKENETLLRRVTELENQKHVTELAAQPVVDLQRSLKETEVQQQQLQIRLDQLNQEREEAAADNVQLQKKYVEAEAAREQSEASFRQQLAAADSEMRELRLSLAASEHEAADLRAQLHQKDNDFRKDEALQHRCTALEDQLQAATSKAEHLEEDLLKYREESAQMQQRPSPIRPLPNATAARSIVTPVPPHADDPPQDTSPAPKPLNMNGGAESDHVGMRPPSQVELLRMSRGMYGRVGEHYTAGTGQQAKVSAPPPRSPPRHSPYNRVLGVYSEEKPVVQGTYEMLEDVLHNGYPMWACRSHRIFSSREGYWMVSADEAGPQKNVGRLVSSSTHEGKSPEQVTSWDYSNGTEWVASVHTRVVLPYSRSSLSPGGDNSSISSRNSSPQLSQNPTSRPVVPSCVPPLPLPTREELAAIDLGLPQGWKVSKTGSVIGPEGRWFATTQDAFDFLERQYLQQQQQHNQTIRTPGHSPTHSTSPQRPRSADPSRLFSPPAASPSSTS